MDDSYTVEFAPKSARLPHRLLLSTLVDSNPFNGPTFPPSGSAST